VFDLGLAWPVCAGVLVRCWPAPGQPRRRAFAASESVMLFARR
jgi:hypothetical protein